MVTLLTAFGPQHSQLESAVCTADSKPIASHPSGSATMRSSQPCCLRFCASEPSPMPMSRNRPNFQHSKQGFCAHG